jgi:hypothetical protein
MSSYVNVPEASGFGSSRKRSIEYPDSSAPTTPPKVRRTLDSPQSLPHGLFSSGDSGVRAECDNSTLILTFACNAFDV